MALQLNFIPKPSYTARDYASIVDELSVFVKKTRPDVWSDFFESSLGTTLIELNAYVGDIVSYGLDSVANEMFLATCRRLESALRAAKSVGYKPRAATSAEAQIKSLELPEALILNGGTLLAGQHLTGANGLIYELLEDVAIPVGATVVRCTVHEGLSRSEEFSPTSRQNQEIIASIGVVEDKSWVVLVGDPDNSDNIWTEVDNVQFEEGPTKSYDTFVDAQGRLNVRFGDGDAGEIPSEQITLKYRTTSGSEGNCPVSSIKGSLSATLPSLAVVTVPFENRDDQSELTANEELQTNEFQSNTVNSAIQTGTVTKSPVVTGSVILTLRLAAGAGTLVFQDDDGELALLSNDTALELVSSIFTYSTGAWGITLDTAIAAGGTITAEYYFVAAGSALNTAVLGAASGGDDRESLEELKSNIPAYIRAQDRILTLDDYDAMLLRVPGVELVFADRWVSSYSANLVKIHTWTTETVDFTTSPAGLTNPLDGTTSKTKYRRYKQVQHDKVNDILNFVRPRSMLSVHNVILRPEMLWVDLYFGKIIYDKRQPKADTHQKVCDAIVSLFHESNGFLIKLADIYNAVHDVPGVRRVNIDRIATGTQAYSTELQGVSPNSTVISGTLLHKIVSPGTVEISIEQTTKNKIILRDDSNGQLFLDGGVAQLLSGNVNYEAGTWAATFQDALIPNQNVYASYSDIEHDYRLDQIVTLDAATDNDPYPPPGVGIVNPVTTPPYRDGKPLTAGPYSGGMQLIYEKLQDITVNAEPANNAIYDETYLYNNEIFYDSVRAIMTQVRAINLRKLSFDLVPQ